MNKEIKVIAQNKKANHDYFIEDTYEAGLVLTGTEIKSIRRGRINLKDSYCQSRRGEMFVYNMHISHFEEGNRFNHEPLRVRKLLLKKKQIAILTNAQNEAGISIIPLKLYIKNGYAKLLIGVAKGKKNYDKRESLKEKDMKRNLEKRGKYEY